MSGNIPVTTLLSRTGDDTLRGDEGDGLFVFADGGGQDTITDFTAGAGTDDSIDLTGEPAVNSLADVLALATQVGSDTVSDLGAGDSITLLGVNVGDLHDNDFLF